MNENASDCKEDQEDSEPSDGIKDESPEESMKDYTHKSEIEDSGLDEFSQVIEDTEKMSLNMSRFRNSHRRHSEARFSSCERPERVFYSSYDIKNSRGRYSSYDLRDKLGSNEDTFLPDLADLQREEGKRRPSLIMLQSEDTEHPDLNTIQAVADRLYGTTPTENGLEEIRGRGRLKELEFRSLEEREDFTVSPIYVPKEQPRSRGSSITRVINKKMLKLRARRQSLF